jgi:glycosyltransferase involved in cell wall biosynthesis
MIDVSIIIPAYDEEESIPDLVTSLDSLISGSSLSYEAIIVDDGSHDKTYEVARKYADSHSFLKVVKHQRNFGKTRAVLSGLHVSSGRLLVIMDADLQYVPSCIPNLVNKSEEGFDVVTGWKKGKYQKKFVSSVYNWLSRRLFNIPIHDQNGIKLLKREVLEDMQLRKDWHRYIVALACDKGYRVGEVPVDLYPRKYGRSKYGGSGRVIIGVLDMIAVKFQISLMRKPLLLFGSLGGLSLIAGLAVGLFALYQRFALQRGFRPFLYLVILLVVVGILLIVLGFVFLLKA